MNSRRSSTLPNCDLLVRKPANSMSSAKFGNAYAGPGPRVPSTLRDALDAWEHSQLARKAFGSDVVEHYANGAKVELAAFDAAVTDWELLRSFERM